MDGRPWGVAAYMVGMCAITAIAVYAGPETCRVNLRAEKPGANA
jgi:hypothetical protein